MRVSVSNLDLYRSWKAQEDLDMGWLLKALQSKEPTEPMLRGRAFANCMERVREGEVDQLSFDGYTFCFTGEFTIESFPRREESREKDYGDIVVSARCDRVLGKVIIDDKNTEHFDAEKYLEKFQSRFYLDMFGADKFVWNVWEVKEMDEPKTYCVHTLHVLTQYRYPEMEAECRDLAQEYRDFAARWIPAV
jgi:hypothetical protein